METEDRWCDNTSCFDYGKIGIGNIKVYSYAESRFYGTACQRTFSADGSTFVEMLRTPRPMLLDAISMLVEHNSLQHFIRKTTSPATPPTG